MGTSNSSTICNERDGVMSITQFITKYRRQIDKLILSVFPNADITDSDRKQWVLNNDKLYKFAIKQGLSQQIKHYV